MSNETKHTPGPWGIEEGASTRWIGPMRRSGFKVASIVCSVDGGARDGYSKASQEEREANARLIAAAPTLLAALEAVAIGVGNDSVTLCTKANNLAGLFSTLREIACEAIEKATGGLS